MRRAIEHARRGLGRTTPNPIVGACVVSDEGVVIGQGAHEFAGGPHAEINALDEAGADARGATLYCTLEPCSHTGRTGPCSERIVAAGIRRVVAAMEDPFPLVSGRGFAALRAQGIEVDIGVEHDAAVRLNQPFLTAVRTGRPFVILKAATSLDGRIAVEGERTSLSSLGALRHAQYMRATVDAIGVGSETLLIDDPLLTARDVYRERPPGSSDLRPPPADARFGARVDDPRVGAGDNSDSPRRRAAGRPGRGGLARTRCDGHARERRPYRVSAPPAPSARHPEPGD